ncbi:hypothetical protein HPB52_002531 [Rhipicephalus sanguineus]|uniref:Uncharacterized protein n=1 Tax=Rhipicephalus sanguineus TaxID=34632 RepID=A0A9D4T359_RHISA|nr:hypothetical protein HPB52_002531 [Rhipicephalus sanguineus]
MNETAQQDTKVNWLEMPSVSQKRSDAEETLTPVRCEPGLGYTDLAEVVADFCKGTFEITHLYDDNECSVAAAFLRMLHASQCVANVVDLSGGRWNKLTGNQTFEWTRDAQRKFKILLANVSHENVDRLLQPLSPLKAQIGALCHLTLPENSTREKFVEPLVPFRSLNCCRALNIAFSRPDVPRSLIVRISPFCDTQRQP